MTLSRRQFLGAAGIAALIALTPPATHHKHIPDYACQPGRGVIGDCYAWSRGTYHGWPAPGIPPEMKGQ